MPSRDNTLAAGELLRRLTLPYVPDPELASLHAELVDRQADVALPRRERSAAAIAASWVADELRGRLV